MTRLAQALVTIAVLALFAVSMPTCKGCSGDEPGRCGRSVLNRVVEGP